MIKFCVEKWEKNNKLLEEAIRSSTDMNTCCYKDLVEMVVKYIFNDGDYQGTLLFLIPTDTYQPGPGDYLMTSVYYGSCSGCDTLQGIQDYGDDPLTKAQVEGFMSLCRNLVQNTIKPYNIGWQHDERFDLAEVEE